MSTESRSEINITDPEVSKYPGKGFRIGDYTIVDQLGHGAMATVFLARDNTGHDVALKVFQESPGVSTTMLERFRREAEASKKLRRHPNIIPIYATGRDGPYHYIAMESVKGSRTLEDVLDNTSMSVADILNLVIKIARALHYAHKHHIIHRDVKLTNIMVDEFGEPLLSDFGVAALVDWPSFTLSGALTGTPLYMSPEQARGERVGPGSDIYSLGVVLYEAITGVLPYSTQHFAPVKSVLDAVKNEAPRRPRIFRKEISPDLEAVILQALEKDPGDRYADAESFAEDLERVQAGRAVSARYFSPWDRLRFLLRRYRRPLGVLVALAVVGLATAEYYRQKLKVMRAENLLRLAQLRNATLTMAAGEQAAAVDSDARNAWNGIRAARKFMTSGDWGRAQEELHSAAESCLAKGDQRTAAVVQLDEARCQVMLNNRQTAKGLYLAILKYADASKATLDLAQLECVTLVWLGRERRQAQEVLQLREQPQDGPVRMALDCLMGAAPPGELAEALDRQPDHLRNDLALALAVRYLSDGENKRSAFFLKRCLQVSAPPSEWPAPFARKLFNETVR